MSEPLHRLLGPAAPELTCDECFEHLDAYVELELRARERADRALAGMSPHLEGCPACAEEHASLLALVAEPHTAPDDHKEQR